MNLQKILFLAVVSVCFIIAWYDQPLVAPNSSATDIPKAVTRAPSKFVMSLIEQPKMVTVIKPKPLLISKPLHQVEQAKLADKPITMSLWRRLTNDFQLDHQTEKSEVKAEIRKLLADQGKFHQILQAAGPYIYYILEQTHSRGLPAEIALIPIIESEFNPNNRSHKGALGLWQLMRGTASILGVNMTSVYDGRRNVIFSTHAALAYLKDLGKNFKGNWYLAFAAYNAGQGRIESAIRRTGSRSFWNLPLAKETKYYVPKLLAVAAIIKHPEKYGIKLPPVNNQPFFIELKTKKAVNLETIAKSTGMNLDILRKLNPDYKQGTIVPKKGAYTLLVPIEHEKIAKTHLAGSLIVL